MTLLCVLGPIAASDGTSDIAIAGPSLRNLLAVLVAAGDRGTSSSVIAENLWSDDRRPNDPTGAVRVYIGRLRKALGESAIITSDTGYRLGDVTSDAALFESLVADARSESRPERARAAWASAVDLWRGDAFDGAEDLPLVEPVARRLEELRLEAIEAWIDARLAAGETRGLVSDAEAIVRKQPLHEGFRAIHMTSLAAVGRLPEALDSFQDFRAELAEIGLVPSQRLVDLDARLVQGEAVVPQSAIGVSPQPDHDGAARRLETLHGCSSAWLQGDIDAAVDALVAGADDFETDVVRRIHRCLTTVEPGEPLTRQLWGFLIQDWMSLPAAAARTLASIDARTLELTGPSGLDIADAEVDAASEPQDLVRSLRVRFQVGLGRPIDDRQLEVVQRLAAIDDPDAAVESLRFDAIVMIKRGRMNDAVERLRQYATTVAEAWPGSNDDFAAMAMHVLTMHPDREALGIPAPTGSSFPVFVADAMAARVSSAWHEVPSTPDARTFPYGFTQVLDTTTPDCATALQLRWCLKTEQMERAAAYADQLQGRLDVMPRDRWFASVPAALSEFAVRTGDRNLADVLTAELEPWSDEVLGLWPSDAIIGPAHGFIEALQSMPSRTRTPIWPGEQSV